MNLEQPEKFRQTCLKRAQQHFREFLLRGNDVSFDENGDLRHVRIRSGETLTMYKFCIVSKLLGEECLAIQIMSARAKTYDLNIHRMPLQKLSMVFSHAAMQDKTTALSWLKDSGPQGPKLFELLGIINDKHEIWHGLGDEPLFQAHYEASKDEITQQRQAVLEQIRVIQTKEFGGQDQVPGPTD